MPDPEALERIKRLKYDYCYHLDRGNDRQFLDLFTDDATFRLPRYGTGSGRDDLESFISSVSDRGDASMAHMASNPRIDIDGCEATGRWYYTVMVESDGGTVSFGHGEWEDEYRYDDVWRISSLVARRRHTIQFPDER